MRLVAVVEQLPVREARAGNEAAWDTLFRRYQLPLYVYVFELVRHEQDALDLVQETFINAVRHLPGLREDEKFGSWLFRIAHQKCIQLWRRRNRADEMSAGPLEDAAEDFADPAPEPLDWLIRHEREEEFMAMIARLPGPQRSVLLLRFVEDFALEEIATITGTPLGTVKSRLHYAKKALRKLVEEDSLT